MKYFVWQSGLYRSTCAIIHEEILNGREIIFRRELSVEEEGLPLDILAERYPRPPGEDLGAVEGGTTP